MSPATPIRTIDMKLIDARQQSRDSGLEYWDSRFPQGVHRVRLLHLMTGTERSVATARYVSRGTHVLVNAAYALGDFGQHQEGARIDVGTAYAALHLCIELSASLRSDLLAAS